MEYISKEKVLELWRYWKHIEAYDQTAATQGIRTKRVKYFDEDEAVWKVGDVIIDGTNADPFIRCKDCKNFDPGEVEHEYERCRHHWSAVREDDFCSFGERRTDE